MKLYKLTDQNYQTKGQTQWGENITHTATGGEDGLCSSGFIHAYEHPLIAAFMNPAHANFTDPILWKAEAEGDTIIRDSDLKCGCKTLTTIRRIPLPVITTKQRIAIGIHCASAVYRNPSFIIWANAWLSNENRDATYAAYAAADATAADAAATADAAAAYAAATYAAYADAAAAYAATHASRYAAFAATLASRYAAANADTFKVLPYILKARRN